MNSNRYSAESNSSDQQLRIPIDIEESDKTVEEWQALFDEYMMDPAQPHVAS